MLSIASAPTAVTSGRNKYLDILDAEWAAHLAPRAADAPIVISLFAGCGGSSLGYSMAGYRELLAVEWDANAVATFKLNFPDVPIHHGDITKLSVDQMLTMTGLEPGELDVLDGSPPCQGFSTAGKRNLDDPRNSLFREYVRLLRGLRPKVFVMENVSGMVKGKMKLVFADCLRELKASGYCVSARLMNAMYFNVPQSRQRMIFIGVREDLRIEPSHPKAAAIPVVYRDAAARLETTEQESHLVSPLRAKRWAETPRGDAHHERFSLLRLAWNKTPPTLLKVPGSGGHMHPDEPRLLNVGELRRVASFPDAFRFVGSWDDAVCRMGNSVPPLFMRAIAEHIRTAILERID
jgi:DNA (cytosine-5)-methyltransferase 1